MSQKTSRAYAKFLEIGILASVFLPLIYLRDTFSPFHFTKVMVFRVLVEILFAVWLVLAIADKKYRPRVNLIFWLVNALFLAYLVTSILGVDFSRSFWGTLERMGGFILQLHFWLYFIVLISVFQTREQWEKLLRTSVIASFLCSLYALGQKANLGEFFLGGGRERVFGTLGNPALFAGYTLFNFFWALYFVLKKNISSSWRKFLIGVALLQAITIFMTAVRGAILALLGGIVLLGIFYIFLQGGRKSKLVTLGAILLIVVVGFSFWLVRDTQFVQDNQYLARITDISLQTTTVQTRLTTWGIAWQSFKDKPLFGWGPENFGIAFAAHFNPFFFEGFGSETYWDRAHNVFLDILTAQGALGMVVYLSLIGGILYLIYRIFREGDKEAQWLGAVMLTILAVYHVHTFFILDVFSTYLMLFILWGLAYFVYKRLGEEDNTAEDNAVLGEPKTWLLTAELIIIFVLMFPLVVSPIKSNYIGTRAVVASWSEKHEETIAKYHEALDPEVFPAYEIRHKLASYAYQAAKNDKLSDQQKIETLNYALAEVQKNIDEHPQDYLPYLYKGRLLSYQSQFDKEAAVQAEKTLRESLKYNPVYARTYYEIGQAQVLQGAYEKALKTYDYAISLNPEIGVAYWYKAATYYFLEDWAGVLELADLALVRNHAFQADEVSQVMSAAAKLNDFSAMVKWNEKLVQLDGSAKNYASLAVAYKQNGQYQEAIAAAQKAAQIDESYQAEARAFIQELNKN